MAISKYYFKIGNKVRLKVGLREGKELLRKNKSILKINLVTNIK